jgi:hypothetical protein
MHDDLTRRQAHRPAQERGQRVRLGGSGCQEIDLGPCLLFGKGEDAAGGRTKPSFSATRSKPFSVPCTSTEVPPAAFALIERLLVELAWPSLRERLDRLDYKTVLQELTARQCTTLRRCTCSVMSGPTTTNGSSATVIVAGQ